MNDLTDNIKKAFEHKSQGNYKEAIDCLYKALALDNDSIEIMSELAVLYSKLHQYDRAVNFYDQILNKNPEDYKSRQALSKIYKKNKNYKNAEKQLMILFEAGFELVDTAEMLFVVLLKQNKYQQIIDLYNSRANSLVSGMIYLYVAQSYSQIGKQTIAEEFYKKSFETDEKNIDSGAYLANGLFERGLYEEAENLLMNLLKHSESDKIFFLLAEIYYIKSQYDEAIKYYSMAIKRNDKNADYFYKLGVVYTLKGFIVEAEENFCRAITLEHENLLYNYTLAYLYYVNGKYSLASRIADYILSVDSQYLPGIALGLLLAIKSDDITKANNFVEILENKKDKDELSFYALALYFAKLNRWEKAVYNIQKAINCNQASCEYKYELAKYYFYQKNYENSKEICNFILKLNDKYINAYILLARLHFEQHDFEKSAYNIDKTLNLDINIPEIYILKGNIARIRKNINLAIENYKTALSINPSEIEYYALIADCYYELSNYECAYTFYKEASDIDITNAKYRYYMAKCCEETGEDDKAIVNYSVAKRLMPENINYLTDYAAFLFKKKQKKPAVKLIKSSMKLFSKEEKLKLKQLIESFK